MTKRDPPAGAARLRCVHYCRECRLERGGVAAAVLDLCGELAGRGLDVTLLTFDAGDVPGAWRDGRPGCPETIELPRARLGRMALRGESLDLARRAIAKTDLVHLHTPWDPNNLAVARAARGAGRPYVVTIHGMLDDWSMAQKRLKKRAFLAACGRRFLESAARIHFTAESELTQAARWIPSARARSTVVPLIVDLSAFDDLPGTQPAYGRFPAIDRDMPSILFLSRLHPKKGIEFLIDAAAILRRDGRAVQLLIAGPGPPSYVESLKRSAALHGISDGVHFLGMVRGEEKISLYQLADLFVLPTHQENFGLVLVEALASGTPVITTRGTDIWQELEAAGAVITPRTGQAIAQAAAPLLDDRARRAELGNRGRRYVLDWLDRDRLADQYVELYRDAITSRAAERGADSGHP